MAQQTLNNGISGAAFRDILNSNFTDLYSNKSPNNHASSSTMYGVASNNNFGHVKVSSNTGININNGVLSLNISSQNDATSGISNSSVMTPIRVKEAVNAYSVVSDGNIILKISDTQPEPQTGKTIIWINSSEL